MFCDNIWENVMRNENVKWFDENLKAKVIVFPLCNDANLTLDMGRPINDS